MPRNVAIGLGSAEISFADAAGYWRWVDLCEAGGIDSLWQSDRLVSGEPSLECLSALAAIAGRTRRLKFGMDVLSMAFRDPVLVARQCTTIDFLSQGRLLPAFGVGSPRAPEWQALSIDTKTRGARTDEGLAIVRRLWSETNVDFDGRFFHLKDVTIAPRPVQAPLPMWIGGGSDAAIRRTARFGTGWQGASEVPAEAARIVAAIKAAAGEAGRVIDEDHYGINIVAHFGAADDPVLVRAQEAYRRRTGRDPEGAIVTGGPAAMMERIAAYVEAGIFKFVVRLLADGEAALLAHTRLVIDEILPAVAARWPKQPKTI